MEIMETKLEIQNNESTLNNLNEIKQEENFSANMEIVKQSIHLSEDKLGRVLNLSGVQCQGVQYYDLKNVLYINNTGLANFIDLLKTLIKKGLSLRFVNVNDKIKEKIRSMGLDKVLNCS